MEKMNILKKYENATALFLMDQEALGVSRITLTNYRNRLGYFADFLKTRYADTDAEMITAADAKAWRDDLLVTRKASTVKQYMIELKAFFEAVCDEENGYPQICEKNPISKKMLPKTAREEARPYEKEFTEEDYKLLWQNQKPNVKGISDATWARNYAIVVLLLDSKIRNEELLDLRLSDIDFEYGEAVVRRGKGNKYRIVTLSDLSITAIQLYLKSGMRPADLDDSDYLFGTTAQKGDRISGNQRNGNAWHQGTRQWLSQLVERHVKNVTGKEGFRSHSLRHAGSALDLNAGVTLERLQAELGHASVSTTEIYTGKLKSIRRASRSKEILEEKIKCAEMNKMLLGIA